MIENGRLLLSADREVAWAEYGVPTGPAVLFFHGGSDSRLAGRLLAGASEEIGIRLICPDRPGFGASTFQKRRTFRDYPADISELTDHLGVADFAVLGHSGGGPHALACAAMLDSRVCAASTVSSVAPPDAATKGIHPAFRFVNFLMKSPRMYRSMVRSQVRQMHNSPQRWLDVWGRMQPADGDMFKEHPETANEIVNEMVEAIRNGIDGVVHEASLYHRAWDINLTTITPPTHIWHGLNDRQAAPSWARHLAATIPTATLTMVRDGGHFSTMTDHADQIFSDLIQHF